MTRTDSTKTPADRFAADQWHAVVVSQDGFVMEDDHVRGWVAAELEGDAYFVTDAEPRKIVIVTGSARPMPQSKDPDEQFYRMPSGWVTAERFMEIDDLDDEEPEDILRMWVLAQGAAQGMNAALDGAA